MRVASKVGNLRSEFRHAGPLSSRVIRYVRDGGTDRRTDRQKQRLLSLSLRARHNKHVVYVCTYRSPTVAAARRRYNLVHQT